MSHVFTENDSPAAELDRRDAFHWRVVGTALSFVAFGLGALLLSLTVMPVLRLLPPRRCQRVARGVLRRGMRCFVALMRGLGVLTYEFRGVERLGEPGQLILANHPTLIDAVFLIAFTHQPLCVAKAAMFRNPLIRNVVRAAGYVSNASTPEMIEGAAAALAAGQCLIMFPEGTRTRPGASLSFQRGAAYIAVRASARITPVYIDCDPVTLTKGEPWYRAPPRRPHFTLRVGEDFSAIEYRTAPAPLASRALNEQLRTHFESELQKSASYTHDGGASTSPGSS